MRALCFAAVLAVLSATAFGQDIDAGRRTFETRCGRCHAADGTGTEMGPAILQRLKSRNDAQLSALIHDGVPLRGMPANIMPEGEVASLPPPRLSPGAAFGAPP